MRKTAANLYPYPVHILRTSEVENCFDYAYDPIGNRTSATYYDEQGEAVASAYSANALNQYTQRTVPGNVQIRGEADTDAIVTVNENPTWRYPSLGGSAAQTSPRSGATSAQPQLRRKAAETSVEVGGGSASYFYGGDYADNSALPVFKELEIAAVVPATSPDGWDEMSAVTGRVFVAQNPEQFTYDADGNMTCDGRFRYTWNGENRLVRAQELVAPTNRNPYTVTYAYDHKGRMVSKRITENDGNDTLVKSTTYLWDGWNIIREVQVSGVRDQGSDSVVVTDNVWGLDIDGALQGAGGVGGLLAVVRDDGVFLPTYDANGNISEYVSTNGEIVAHYDYSPFGEPLVASGPLAATFTHQFSTKPYCVVTGFSEYQMRKYRPEIGRWMSRDPIEEIDPLQLDLATEIIEFSNKGLLSYAKHKPSKIAPHHDHFYENNILPHPYLFVENEVANNVEFIGLFLIEPCDSCEYKKCDKLCKYLAKRQGFPTYTVLYCNKILGIGRCKCAGMCKLLMEVPPPEKSGGHTTCEYDCGSFHRSIKIYGKCPDPGWYKL